MPTAKEATIAYESKAAELKAWLDPKTTPDGFDFQGDELKAFNDRNDELGQLFDAKELALTAEGNARKSLDLYADSQKPARHGLFGGTPDSRDGRYEQRSAIKSLGDMFLESEEYKANSDKTLSSTGEWKVELKGVDAASTLKAITIGSGQVLPYAQQPAGVVPYAIRTPVVRNLLRTVDPQGQYNLQFIRENVFVNNADIVAEGGTKPLSDSQTERVLFTLEAVAHGFKVTNQALRFIPGIRERLNQKGSLGIMLAEEDKILNYNGSAGWKGFYVQTGVQTTVLGGQDPFSAFHAGMTTIAYTPGYARVTGGVIHPNDWHRVVIQKDTTGRFIFGDPSSAEQSARLWGVPLIPTPAATEGTPLIGDFDNYAQLWVDPTMTVAVGYENDDIRKNQQTIIIEEYMALEIDRPAAFTKLPGWDTIV